MRPKKVFGLAKVCSQWRELFFPGELLRSWVMKGLDVASMALAVLAKDVTITHQR